MNKCPNCGVKMLKNRMEDSIPSLRVQRHILNQLHPDTEVQTEICAFCSLIQITVVPPRQSPRRVIGHSSGWHATLVANTDLVEHSLDMPLEYFTEAVMIPLDDEEDEELDDGHVQTDISGVKRSLALLPKPRVN